MRRWSMNLRCRTMPSPHWSSMLETAAGDFAWDSAASIAAAVTAGRVSATHIVEATLARVRERDPLLNSFTAVTERRALARAKALDAAQAKGERLPALAGVPFAVKNLFDIAGLPTLAGSKINRDLPPAPRDAALIARLETAGAILVGALNMGEYAYDFTGENIHDGPSRNPHDLNRMTGGSSGGSGAAVGGGLVAPGLRSRHNRLLPVAGVAGRGLRAQANLWAPYSRADISIRSEPRSFGAVCAHDARSRPGLRRHAGFRRRRSGLCRSRGGTDHATPGQRSRRPAYRGRRRLLQGQDRRACRGGR